METLIIELTPADGVVLYIFLVIVVGMFLAFPFLIVINENLKSKEDELSNIASFGLFSLILGIVFTIAIVAPIPSSLQSINFESFKSEVKNSEGMRYYDEEKAIKVDTAYSFIDPEGKERSCLIEETEPNTKSDSILNRLIGAEKRTAEFELACVETLETSDNQN